MVKTYSTTRIFRKFQSFFILGQNGMIQVSNNNALLTKAKMMNGVGCIKVSRSRKNCWQFGASRCCKLLSPTRVAVEMIRMVGLSLELDVSIDFNQVTGKQVISTGSDPCVFHKNLCYYSVLTFTIQSFYPYHRQKKPPKNKNKKNTNKTLKKILVAVNILRNTKKQNSLWENKITVLMHLFSKTINVVDMKCCYPTYWHLWQTYLPVPRAFSLALHSLHRALIGK